MRKKPIILALAGVVTALVGGSFVAAQTDIALTESVVIAAPPKEVFEFLDDSGKARGWSIFFDHISTLPGSADGLVGARRRCFRRADEQGPRWDEVVQERDPFRNRLIHVYGAQGFRYGVFHGVESTVRHTYEEIAPGRTRLTFTARVVEGGPVSRWLLLLANRETQRIFRFNLANIRDMIEQKDAYRRQHPWEAVSASD